MCTIYNIINTTAAVWRCKPSRPFRGVYTVHLRGMWPSSRVWLLRGDNQSE